MATESSFGDLTHRRNDDDGQPQYGRGGSGSAAPGGAPRPAPRDVADDGGGADERRGERALRRRVRRAQPGAGEQPQRLPDAGLGHQSRQPRVGDPAAAAGLVLPGLAAGAPPAGGGGPGPRGGGRPSGWGPHAGGGGPGVGHGARGGHRSARVGDGPGAG